MVAGLDTTGADVGGGTTIGLPTMSEDDFFLITSPWNTQAFQKTEKVNAFISNCFIPCKVFYSSIILTKLLKDNVMPFLKHHEGKCEVSYMKKMLYLFIVGLSSKSLWNLKKDSFFQPYQQLLCFASWSCRV